MNGQRLTVGPYGSVVTGVVTGTGFNGASPTATFRFTVVRPTTGGLVRTGASIARWTPLGLGLVGLGHLLMVGSRRRVSLTAGSPTGSN